MQSKTSFFKIVPLVIFLFYAYFLCRRKKTSHSH